MSQGLLYCGSNWSNSFCIGKLIESIISGILIVFIVYEAIAQVRQTGIFSYRFVQVMQTLMLFTLIYNIAFSLDHTIFYLYYLESLFYDWYFCTLVFYVTYKIFTKNRSQNKNKLLFLKISFSFLLLVFVGIFIYSVIVDIQACQQIWFLVIDIFGLILCLIMIIIGRKHQRKQLQKILDFSNSEQIKNPLSRMWVLIFVNLVCQLVQFIQSLVFLIQTSVSCAFTSNEVVNEILKVLFSMLSLHTSFICTIILFRLRRKGEIQSMRFKRRSETNESFELNQLTVVRYTSYPKESGEQKSSRASQK